MGITNNCVRMTKVELKTTDEKYVDELYLHLSKEFAVGEWEWYYEKDWYVISCIEHGKVTYYPGCRYTSNGDGYPDEYDEDFEIWEDDVEDEIEKFVSKHYEDVITEWSVSQDSEYGDDYYD